VYVILKGWRGLMFYKDDCNTRDFIPFDKPIYIVINCTNVDLICLSANFIERDISIITILSFIGINDYYRVLH